MDDELDSKPNTTTTATRPDTQSESKVETAPVEAPVKDVPGGKAPELKDPYEYFEASAVKRREKEKAAETPNADAAPGKVEAPAGDTDAAGKNPPATTTTEPPVDYKTEYEKILADNQRKEQDRQAAEVRQLTERQQAELRQDQSYAERSNNAYNRKHAQVTSLERQIAEARAERDFEVVEVLTQQHDEAYDEALVLWETKVKADQVVDGKAKYFQTQYANSRSKDNERALEGMLRPYGLELKAVMEKVPEQYKNNLFAVADTALKEVAGKKDAEIADLKKQLKETETRVRAEERGKWDSTNPAGVKHADPGTGGANGEPKWSPDQSPYLWFGRSEAKKRAAAQ